MKRPKQKPRHSATPAPACHPERSEACHPERSEGSPDAAILAGEQELSDFMEALNQSANPDTVKPLHRDSDFDTLRPAETLAAFVTFCADVRQRYQGNLQVQDDTSLERQDLLHCIELSDNMRVADGFKMYRKLREVSRVRRDAKNENDLLQPLYDFLTQTDFESRLRRVLGDTRTRAEVVGKRQYSLRTDIVEREDV